VRKSWFFGQKTSVFAMILEYSHISQPFQKILKSGFDYSGELVFYPSAWPQRAIATDLEILENSAIKPPPFFENFEKTGEFFADALAKNPLLSEIPAPLENVQIIFQKNKFELVDSSQKIAPISCEKQVGWQILAKTGGQKFNIFTTWNGRFFEIYE
jgi:hypothetical protein